jgi:spermidine/putrescine transport system substrate-binding protein
MTNELMSLHPRMRRVDFLKGLGAAGVALFLGGCGSKSSTPSQGSTSHPPISQEPGVLSIFDYEGYDSKPLWTGYAKQFPNRKPHWAFFNSDQEALARVLAGFRPDVAHPCSGYVKSWVDANLLQPWDTSLISNFPDLNKGLVTKGQINGKQYQIPSDWGFISVMYRNDKVHPDENSLGLLFEGKKYPGKITWYDNPADMMFLGGYVVGAADPFNMTDDELAAVKAKFVEAKPYIRNFWNSETAMQQDFASGNVWITYAWPSDWVAVKKKVPTTYMKPKEGYLAFDCGFGLMAQTKNYHHAHDYVNAWVSPHSGEWLLNNFAYGSSNTKVDLNKVPAQLVDVFHLRDPGIIASDQVHVLRYNANQAKYNRIWQEIKAA